LDIVLFDKIKIKKVSPEEIAFELVKLALGFKNNQNPAIVTYLNAYHFNLASNNERYRQALEEIDFIYADGWSIVLALRLFGKKLPERLTAADFFFDFCQLCWQKDVSLFLLGGEERVVKNTEKKLSEKFPGLDIRGSYHGYFSQKEETVLISKINKLNPDFLIVNMGAPKQELWLVENIDKLNIKVGWCVGGLFNYISGKTPRCPYWLGKVGGEWFFRLCAEPKRLWKRYVLGLPLFCYYLLKLKWKDVKKS
jgi:N-acetylglucosaminyldiphosphoundecaprenol N-acetyl-beta-D-mannosaminyltransferase